MNSHQTTFPVQVARLATKLSQREAAELAGIHNRHWQRIERQRQEPSLRVARAIAAVVGRHPDELFPEPTKLKLLRARMALRVRDFDFGPSEKGVPNGD